MEWADIVKRYASEPRGFRLQVEAAIRIIEKKGEKNFRSTEVHGQNIMGAKVEVRYALPTHAEFVAHFGMKPEAIPGVKLVTEVQDEECQPMSGVLLSLDNCPQALAHRTITLFSEVRNVIAETVLDSAKQIRAEQGLDTFTFCNRAMVSGRTGGLRAPGNGMPRDILRVADIADKVASIQNAREKAEADAEIPDQGMDMDDMHDDILSPAPARGLAPAGIVAIASNKGKAKGAGIKHSSTKGGGKRGNKGSVGPGRGGGNTAAGGSRQTQAPSTSGASLAVCRSLDFPSGISSGSGAQSPLDASGASVVGSSATVRALEIPYPSIKLDLILSGEPLRRSINGVARFELHPARAVWGMPCCIVHITLRHRLGPASASVYNGAASLRHKLHVA